MRKIVSMIVLAVLVAMLSLPVACKPNETPPEGGVKSKIKIAMLDSLSGPVASPAIAQREGAEDAVRYVNERMGGISGHPLDIIVIDCKVETAMAITSWERLENDGVLAIYSPLMGVFPIFPELAQKSHLPLIAGTINDMNLMFPKEPSYAFCTMPATVTSYDAFCDLVEDMWAKKGENRPPKIGYDILALGSYPKVFGKAGKMAAEKRGWEYLIAYTPVSPADVTAEVLQMKQFGADYIYSINTEAANIAWIKEFERQDFHPLMAGSGASVGSEEMRNAVGDLIDGAIFQLFTPLWTDTDEPIVDMLLELNAEWHPEEIKTNAYYIRGFANIVVQAEALNRAVDTVGYDNLNGEAVKEALETLRDFKPAGMRIGYTYTTTDHQGINHMGWYQWLKDGIRVPITGWIPIPTLAPEQRTQAYWLQD